MRIYLFILAMFLISGAAEAVDLRDPAMEKGLVPHRALYDIHLTEIKNASQIVNLTGQMMYEWYPTCDGWVSNHKFNMAYEYADTPSSQVSSDFSNFESFDGKKFDFTSQRKRGGSVFEEIRGYAEIGPSVSKASYKMPKGLVYDLPQNTAFPMAHTFKVMEAIKAGKKFITVPVFDGSDDEGPVEINAFIGKEVAADEFEANKPEIDAALLETPGRKVRLAFFPMKDSEISPDYEMSMVFHENSVMSSISIEYDDFSVRQDLVALERLENECPG